MVAAHPPPSLLLQNGANQQQVPWWPPLRLLSLGWASELHGCAGWCLADSLCFLPQPAWKSSDEAAGVAPRRLYDRVPAPTPCISARSSAATLASPGSYLAGITVILASQPWRNGEQVLDQKAETKKQHTLSGTWAKLHRLQMLVLLCRTRNARHILKLLWPSRG